VPSGGPSPFLRVLALQDKIKYSVRIPGLITIDPEVQSGGDTGSTGGAGPARVPVNFTVYWDSSQPANTMTYSQDGGPVQPLPVTVNVADTVTFNAVVNGNPVVTNFFVAFDGHGWASPFKPFQGKFSAADASTTIGPLTVRDSEDSGAGFAISASITLDGNAVNSAANNSNVINMA